MEVWKNVVGYEGIYEVSNQGRVRTSENKTTFTERHGVRKWKQRVLKPGVRKDNTCSVNLWNNGQKKQLLVHRLVGLAFLPQIEGKDFINHLDGNRLNNCVENLEWCTWKENNNHAFDNFLIPTARPVALICKTTRKEHHFRSMTKAGEFLGKSHGYISELVNNDQFSTEEYEIVLKEAK